MIVVTGMRLILYVLLAVGIFSLLTLSGQPIETYLRSVRNNTRLSQQQNALTRVDQSVGFMKSALTVALQGIPTASRIRVALIHTTISPLGESQLRWSIAAFATAEGHEPGSVLVNQPLNQWADYLGSLLAHECVLVNTDDLKDAVVKKRMNGMKIDAFLVCPIYNKNAQLIGGIFASWDDMLDVPKDLEPTKRVLRTAASLIGAAIKPSDYVN